MGLRITKWYLDVVDADGRTFVGYHARIRWCGLSLVYSSTILSTPDGTHDRCRLTLRSRATPTLRADGVVWTDAGLGVHGAWRGALLADDRPLHEEPGLAMRWHCRMPCADASVCVDGMTLEGRGYTETLCLEGDVALLPVDRIRWGRWVADPGAAPEGDAASVVWIGWEGTAGLTLTLADGSPTERGTVADDRVTAGPHTLRLERVRTLREGRLGATIGAALPAPFRPLARRIGGWHESKWLARGSLRSSPDGPERQGWVIHERIELNR